MNSPWATAEWVFAVVVGLLTIGLLLWSWSWITRALASTKTTLQKRWELSSAAGLLAENPGVPLRFDNVVTRLSFNESLDASAFASASEQAAILDLNARLAASAPNGINMVVNGVRFVQSEVEMVVTASKHGKQLIRDGVAVISRTDGLPILRDAKTGRFLETMKKAKGAQAMTRLASLGAVAVGAAHIISGADIAKRLKAVDAKLDLLLAYRKIDQQARLERIYSEAKEICLGQVTPDKQRRLWKLRGELRELRATWRGEVNNAIKQTEDPNEKSWLQSLFWWVEAVDRAPHEKVHCRMTENQPHLMLIEYSLRLDQVLAVASGTVREFEYTLSDELKALDATRASLREKANLISNKYPHLSAQPIVNAMDAMMESYGGLLPEAIYSRPKAAELQSVEAKG